MPAVVELEKLIEGISGGTPPCSCLWKWVRCGNPSSWRIISTCPHCQHHAVVFVCDRCHEDAIMNGFGCAPCGGIRGIDGYL